MCVYHKTTVVTFVVNIKINKSGYIISNVVCYKLGLKGNVIIITTNAKQFHDPIISLKASKYITVVKKGYTI